MGEAQHLAVPDCAFWHGLHRLAGPKVWPLHLGMICQDLIGGAKVWPLQSCIFDTIGRHLEYSYRALKPHPKSNHHQIPITLTYIFRQTLEPIHRKLHVILAQGHRFTEHVSHTPPHGPKPGMTWFPSTLAAPLDYSFGEALTNEHESKLLSSKLRTAK